MKFVSFCKRDPLPHCHSLPMDCSQPLPFPSREQGIKRGRSAELPHTGVFRQSGSISGLTTPRPSSMFDTYRDTDSSLDLRGPLKNAQRGCTRVPVVTKTQDRLGQERRV